MSPMVPLQVPADSGVLEALASWYSGEEAAREAAAKAGPEDEPPPLPEDPAAIASPEEPQAATRPAAPRPKPAMRRLRRLIVKEIPESQPRRAASAAAAASAGVMGVVGADRVMMCLLESAGAARRARRRGTLPQHRRLSMSCVHVAGGCWGLLGVAGVAQGLPGSVSPLLGPGLSLRQHSPVTTL